jgi:hypothetical protein
MRWTSTGARRFTEFDMATWIRSFGNQWKAAGLIRQAKLFQSSLKNMMGFQGLQQGQYTRTLPDGSKINIRSVMGNDLISITCPPAPALAGQEIVESVEQDVFIAYNVPDRGGAWDVANQQRVPTYRENVPTETWTRGAWNTSSLEGDPVVYWYPHTLSPANDSRFNVLKSWTINLKTAGFGRDWYGTESLTVFHRKSVSFNDVIRGTVFPYMNYGDTIDIYHGNKLANTSVSIVSDLDSTMNFYVDTIGNVTVVKLQAYWIGPTADQFRYLLRSKQYDKTGAELASNTYYSSTIHVDYFDSWGPISVAYDGTDYYCTVNCGDIVGHGEVKAEFTEDFIHTSAVKIYDYDHVDRVVVSMDKTGYTTTSLPPCDQWWLGIQTWYDFGRREWHSLDMFFSGGVGGGEWMLQDGSTSIWTQTSSDPYTGGSAPVDDNPKFWCWYDGEAYGFPPDHAFPIPPAPWNLHWTAGGYRRTIIH